LLLVCLAFTALSAHAQTPAPGTATPAASPPAADASAPAPTAFVVKFKVKLGQNAAFEKVFREMQAGVRDNEPGNLYYDLYRDQDPQTYVIIEHYKDAAAVIAHGKSAHAQKLIAALRDLLDGRPEAQRLVPSELEVASLALGQKRTHDLAGGVDRGVVKLGAEPALAVEREHTGGVFDHVFAVRAGRVFEERRGET
jgi:quinol monooxygenase YgiN